MLLHRQWIAVGCAAFLTILFRAAPGLAINVELQSYQTGLVQPLFATHAGDGSGRFFVVQRSGRIRVIDGGIPQATNLLDVGLSGLNLITIEGSEQGLLGMAFHPNYDGVTNRYFYICYVRAGDGAVVVERYETLAGNPNLADTDPGSRLVILGPIAQPQENHNGGMIAFGPDGYLYIGLGDGGSGDDVGKGHTPDIGNGQDTTNVLGDVLRIDVDRGSPYAIPPNNPFYGSTINAPEIFAYGLRNPWRFSFDRGPGNRLFCGDVGQGAREEISILSPGGNFGWRVMEGNICRPPTIGCDTSGLIPPIFDYEHTFSPQTRCSITGGYVYRGTAYPGLYGLYFYADYCSGEIWSLEEIAPGVWGNNTLRFDADYNISSFAEDEAGEIYVCRFGISTGALYRITDTDPAPTPSPSPTESPTPLPGINASRGWEVFE